MQQQHVCHMFVCIVVYRCGTLGVRVAGHVTASGPLGTWVQTTGGKNLGRPQEVKSFQIFASFGPIETVEM